MEFKITCASNRWMDCGRAAPLGYCLLLSSTVDNKQTSFLENNGKPVKPLRILRHTPLESRTVNISRSIWWLLKTRGLFIDTCVEEKSPSQYIYIGKQSSICQKVPLSILNAVTWMPPKVIVFPKERLQRKIRPHRTNAPL